MKKLFLLMSLVMVAGLSAASVEERLTAAEESLNEVIEKIEKSNKQVNKLSTQVLNLQKKLDKSGATDDNGNDDE